MSRRPSLQIHVRGLHIEAQSIEGSVVNLTVSAHQQHRSLVERLRKHLAHALFRAGDLCYPSNDHRALRVVAHAVPLKTGHHHLSHLADAGPREVVPFYDALGNAHYQALVIHERVEHHHDGIGARIRRAFGQAFGRDKRADDSHGASFVAVDSKGFEGAIVLPDTGAPAKPEEPAPATFSSWIEAQQWDRTPRLENSLAPPHEFRIKVPGHRPFEGIFPNANAARLEAEQLCPDAHPASVVCISRKRQAARP